MLVVYVPVGSGPGGGSGATIDAFDESTGSLFNDTFVTVAPDLGGTLTASGNVDGYVSTANAETITALSVTSPTGVDFDRWVVLAGGGTANGSAACGRRWRIGLSAGLLQNTAARATRGKSVATRPSQVFSRWFSSAPTVLSLQSPQWKPRYRRACTRVLEGLSHSRPRPPSSLLSTTPMPRTTVRLNPRSTFYKAASHPQIQMARHSSRVARHFNFTVLNPKAYYARAFRASRRRPKPTSAIIPDPSSTMPEGSGTVTSESVNAMLAPTDVTKLPS